MKTLSVGIGCRLHTSADDVETAVRAALGSHAFEEIATVASIETKSHEQGLLDFCARHGLPLKLFSREQIAAMNAGEPCAVARKHLGVDGVCEPCALLAASPDASVQTRANITARQQTQTPAATTARLIVGKTVLAGVTVAIASATRVQADSATITQQDLS
ncbi:cobalamin biosynthesis protein [Paraburkholderia rhynchosiae]|uniref:Cobalamin biosynthesis protein CbiG n=1 Tax=Paraburkholderia rhynchosiae TaxID=487049 RepID=A0A2N7WJB3_9BURK|nr:cobalamin biosynthesis protein [Paraburkholderia rhynchosiae]PMS29441.1 cobalamin biosynthesis protein CbiG [Paraburkholderia rhynchosiae]CAB3704724.1 hypothetical protein LMG27174_03870 [Paraburkholderia rhynchosiae]